LLAYNDVYRTFAYIALLLVPGFLLLSRMGGGETAAAH
jgi:hypothetical protein